MHVASLTIDLHVPDAHSLKEKRAVIRPVLDGCRHRFAVAAAEVGRQDQWQRATLGVATVAGSASHCRDVLERVERFVRSFPEAEVLSCRWDWLEPEEEP